MNKTDRPQQPSLFGEATSSQEKPAYYFGGSRNPIVFHDYDSFVKKFSKVAPNTTDDCYTPPEIYDAVLRYVGTITDLTGAQILRPFYPGGDYENADYPADGIVIDNPPFSFLKKICKFYSAKNIPFFLFAPAQSAIGCLEVPGVSVVFVGSPIIFENGASMNCAFLTNLLGDVLVTTTTELTEAFTLYNKRVKPTKKLRKYINPPEVLGFYDFEKIAKGYEDFAIKRHDAQLVREINGYRMFGTKLIVSTETAAAAEAAAEAAAAEAAAENIFFGPKEIAILEALNERNNKQNNEK